MKYLLVLIISTLFLFSTLFAVESKRQYSLFDALPFWEFAPMKVVTESGESVGVKQFKRVVSVRGTLLPVSTVTLIEFSEKNAPLDFHPFILNLKKQLPSFSQFTSTPIKNGFKAEWYDPKLFRHINIHYQSLGTSRRIISAVTLKEFFPYIRHEISEFENLSASIRLPLVNSVFHKKTTFQSQQLKTSSLFFLSTLVASPLFAQSAEDLTSLLTSQGNNVQGALPNTTGVGTASNPYVAKVGIEKKSLTAIDQTGTKVVDGLKSSTATFDATMKNSSDALLKATSETNTGLNNAANTFDGTMANTSAALLQGTDQISGVGVYAADKISASMDTLSGSMSQAYDPNLVFKLALAGSAGAALGSIFVGLASEGISLATTGLYNLITQSAKKEKLWENFHSAMKEIDDQNAALSKYESDLRDLLGYSKYLRENNYLNKPIFDIGEGLEEQLYISEEVVERAKEDFKERRKCLSIECAGEVRRSISTLEKTTKQIKDVLIVLQKEDKQLLLNEKVCRKLSELKRQVVYLQQSLQTARFKILANENEFSKRLEDEGEDLVDLIEDANKAHKKGQERMEKLVQAYVKSPKESEALRECVMSKSSLSRNQVAPNGFSYGARPDLQFMYDIEQLCLKDLHPEIPSNLLIFGNNDQKLKFSSVQQQDYVYEYIGFFNQIKEENLCLDRLLLSEQIEDETKRLNALKYETAQSCRFSDRVVQLFHSKKALEDEMSKNKCVDYMRSSTTK